MSDTVILQSHRSPLPFDWISRCLDSVACWAANCDFEYRFLGDELFELVDPLIIDKTSTQPVIATDLARLKWCQSILKEGYRRVIWLDADCLVFDPLRFTLPETAFALGREVWVQQDDNRKWRVYKKVHNAFLMFCRENSFLDFYADSAERLLSLNKGSMPPQFIGPKLLTALHNIVQCPVVENAAMISPELLAELIDEPGEAMRLFNKNSSEMPAVVNLGASLCTNENLDDIKRLIDLLLDDPIQAFKPM